MSTNLFSLIADVLLVDASEITADSTFETLEHWDSEREIELALMLEVEFGVCLDVDDMSRLRSVTAIYEVLEKHGVRVS